MRCSGRPRPGCCCPRRCCAGWRVTRRWSRTCSARRGRTWTWGGWCGCSPGRSGAGCGAGTARCTFPGCTKPATWARAHHVLHWVDGGCSDVDNAALVCQQHHTFVHTRRLWATVRKTPDELGRYVIWDLHPGSYDRQLEWLARQRAEHDPPPLTRQRLLRAGRRGHQQRRSRPAPGPARPRPAQPTPGTTGSTTPRHAVDDDDPDYRAWHDGLPRRRSAPATTPPRDTVVTDRGASHQTGVSGRRRRHRPSLQVDPRAAAGPFRRSQCCRAGSRSSSCPSPPRRPAGPCSGSSASAGPRSPAPGGRRWCR